MARICGPGLCHCDDTVRCPECATRNVEAGCDGLCEECYLEKEKIPGCKICGSKEHEYIDCPQYTGV